MEEIDVAAFAFDPSQQLRLVNRAGERLLAQPAERCWRAMPRHLAWRNTWAAPPNKPFGALSPAPPDVGAFGEVSFAKAVSRTNCW